MQTKYAFDKETKRKVFNSFLLSLLSAGGAFISAYQTTGNLRSSVIIALSTGGAFVINLIREYVTGGQ